MRIAITGSSGLVGSALVEGLPAAGHTITRVVRSTEAARLPGRVHWSVRAGTIDAAGLEGHDAVIHLAGENLFGLWTGSRKQRIERSRVEGTALLAATLAGLDTPPAVLLSASAVGFYGDRGSEVLDESSSAGEGFLAEVVNRWESAADPAREAGIRVVHARSGIVLGRGGGALGVMLPVFRLGLGGRVGQGDQMVSWVARGELTSLFLHVLEREELSGAVNVVAPGVVTHAGLVETLGSVLRRPTVFRIPTSVARALGGEMARETVLASQHVAPRKLLESGYRFRYPDLEGALRAELGKRA